MMEKAMNLMQEADSIDGMMANSMRSNAAIYAALAQAEALSRIADALEKLSTCVVGDGELRVYIPDAISVHS